LNDSLTVFPSNTWSTTHASRDLDNPYYAGLHLALNITASGVTVSGGVTFGIEGKDETSDSYYTILSSANLVANGTVVVKVYPGLIAATNLVANDHLPRIWRVTAIHANSDDVTYSVGGSYLD